MNKTEALNRINNGAKFIDCQSGYCLSKFSTKTNDFVRTEVPIRTAKALIAAGIKAEREARTWEIFGTMAS